MVDRISIVPATLEHARIIGETLRPQDRAEIEAVGLEPEVEPTATLLASSISRSGVLDGRVAAMWGVVKIADGWGKPWFLTGEAFCTVPPLRFARIYRGQVAEFLAQFSVLENWVDARYEESIRLLKMTGFSLDDPAPYGQFGALFRRFEVRRG